MKKIFTIVYVGLVLLSLPCLGFSQQTSWNSIRTSTGSSRLLVPRSPVSITTFSKGQPAAAAEQVRSITRSVLQDQAIISAGYNLGQAITSEVEAQTVINTFPVLYNGIPLQDKKITTTVGAKNHSIVAIEQALSGFLPTTSSPARSTEYITASCITYLGDGVSFIQLPTLIYREDKASESLRLCYEVIARDNTRGSWRLTFDATTGELIEKRSRLHYEQNESPAANSKGSIKGEAHLRNPFEPATKVDLPYLKLKAGPSLLLNSDSSGAFTISLSLPIAVSATLNGMYFGIVRNDGPNATLNTTFSSGTSELVFDNSNSDQAERDAYRSANFARSFVRSLDPSLTELDRYMPVNVNLDMTCNAFYDPDSVTLNFFTAGGQDCSNTAEVADVVYHEFGHRAQHAVYSTVLGGGLDISNGALGEGFADIYSAFMRDDPRIGIGFFSDTTQLLRNCKNSAVWPDDISSDVHESGTIIAGAFWDLRQSIGLKDALRLFHYMMYHHPDDPDDQSQDGLYNAFSQTLLATIITDDDNNNLADGTPHLSQILAAFKLHNITLASSSLLSTSVIPDQDTNSLSYPLSITTKTDGVLGVLDQSSIKVYYKVNSGNFMPLETSPTSVGSVNHCDIPKQPAGSIVTYYASAIMPLTGDTVLSSSNTFLVGFRTLYSNDCETNTNWKIGISSDNATTGIWEFGDPFGTYNDPTAPIDFIQQDTDHSPTGINCFVTGNQNLLNQSRSPGYDDVDNGATTLQTPSIPLSSSKNPIVRYWYYYSNDKGFNPGMAQFVVKLSTNNGGSWNIVTKTSASTIGWQQATLVLKDIAVLPLTTIQLRFIASDNVGVLVEAGIDDISVLDPIEDAPQNDVDHQPQADHSIPYPNPAARGSIITAGTAISWLELYDITGKQLLRSEGKTMTIPSQLASGMYRLRTSNNEFFPLLIVE